jgi:hypothetical protein
MLDEKWTVIAETKAAADGTARLAEGVDKAKWLRVSHGGDQHLLRFDSGRGELEFGRFPTSSATLGGWRTALDFDLNRVIERSVTNRLAGLRAENVRDAAVVVLDNRSGEVLGLVGSENYFAPGSGMVNGATQPRSAGSTIKPFDDW